MSSRLFKSMPQSDSSRTKEAYTVSAPIWRSEFHEPKKELQESDIFVEFINEKQAIVQKILPGSGKILSSGLSLSIHDPVTYADPDSGYFAALVNVTIGSKIFINGLSVEFITTCIKEALPDKRPNNMLSRLAYAKEEGDYKMDFSQIGADKLSIDPQLRNVLYYVKQEPWVMEN